MKFAVLFIFGTDVIGDAPYAAFSDDTNGEGVLKVGTTLIRVSTVMGILYKTHENKKSKIEGNTK